MIDVVKSVQQLTVASAPWKAAPALLSTCRRAKDYA